MATLTESAIFEEGIFQLEKSTPPLGGAPMFSGSSPTQGHANAQAAQLANRTQWLKSKVDTDLTEITSYANLRAYTGPATSPNLYDGARSGRFRKVATDPTGYTDDDAVTIIGSNGWVWQRINPTPVMPGWFGVVGDGATNPARNDQLAFNALWRYIEKTDGGLVHIPDGLYLCGGVAGDVFARSVILPKTSINGHTKVVCSPNAIFKRRGPYTLFAAFSDGNSYSEYGSNGRNIEWIGGTLDANAESVGVNNLWQTIGCDNITLRGVTFYNGTGGHCLDINSSRAVNVDSCFFYSEPIPNGIVSKEAIQLAEERQTTVNGGTLGLKDITINNCKFLAKPGQTVGWQIGVGNHSATDGIWNTNIRITNNTFDGCTETGVQIFKHSDCLIQGNIFLSCRDGIRSIQSLSIYDNSNNQDGQPSNRSQAAYNVKVRDNTFYDTLRIPIYLQSPGYTSSTPVTFHEKWLIEGNTIDSPNGVLQTGAAGIVAYWCSNIKVSNNYISNQRRGIEIQYVKDSQFVSNTINTTTFDGIRMLEGIDSDYLNQGITRSIDIKLNNVFSAGTNPYTIFGSSINVDGNVAQESLAADATRVAIFVSANTNGAIITNNSVNKSVGASRLKSVVEVSSGAISCVISNNKGSSNVSVGYPSTCASTSSFLEEVGTVAPEGLIAAPLYSRYYNRSTGISYKKTGGAAGNTGWVVG